MVFSSELQKGGLHFPLIAPVTNLYKCFLVVATNDTLEVGKDALLGCKIEGDIYAMKSFKWYRDENRNNELKDGDRYKINQDNGTLVIKKTS